MRLIDRLADCLIVLAGVHAVASIPGALFESPLAISFAVIVGAGAFICLALRGSPDALAYGLSVLILAGLFAYMWASYSDDVIAGRIPEFVAVLGIGLYGVAIAASLVRLAGLVREAEDPSEPEDPGEPEDPSEPDDTEES
jgi:hypothetical protein